MFASRKLPQESTGFTPFELLYGRTVKGRLRILWHRWTKEISEPEVRNCYQYALKLRERLEETTKAAKEELEKSQRKQKRFFDRRAKGRHFVQGELVLVLLPTDINKLLRQ